MKRFIGETIETAESPGRYCIPGVNDGSHLTLCGFVDVPHTVHDAADHPCNCEQCINNLRVIRAMRFKRGYFAN